MQSLFSVVFFTPCLIALFILFCVVCNAVNIIIPKMRVQHITPAGLFMFLQLMLLSRCILLFANDEEPYKFQV